MKRLFGKNAPRNGSIVKVGTVLKLGGCIFEGQLLADLMTWTKATTVAQAGEKFSEILESLNVGRLIGFSENKLIAENDTEITLLLAAQSTKVQAFPHISINRNNEETVYSLQNKGKELKMESITIKQPNTSKEATFNFPTIDNWLYPLIYLRNKDWQLSVRVATQIEDCTVKIPIEIEGFSECTKVRELLGCLLSLELDEQTRAGTIFKVITKTYNYPVSITLEHITDGTYAPHWTVSTWNGKVIEYVKYTYSNDTTKWDSVTKMDDDGHFLMQSESVNFSMENSLLKFQTNLLPYVETFNSCLKAVDDFKAEMEKLLD